MKDTWLCDHIYKKYSSCYLKIRRLYNYTLYLSTYLTFSYTNI